MLNIFLRAIILYVFLLVAMRLMGKRQLSQLQPFEFAITLVSADLACIPMADNSIPLIYGIIPIITLIILQNIITLIQSKSIKFRKIANGQPVILIDSGVVNCKNLKDCGMTANDLLESLRAKGFFNIADINYCILETNGEVSVLAKFDNSPVTNKDMHIVGNDNNIPYNILMEGRFLENNLKKIVPAIQKADILKSISQQNLSQKDIFIYTLSDNDVYIQTYDGQVIKTILN